MFQVFSVFYVKKVIVRLTPTFHTFGPTKKSRFCHHLVEFFQVLVKLDHLERAKSKRKDAMDKILGTISEDDGSKFILTFSLWLIRFKLFCLVHYFAGGGGGGRDLISL